jgi:hypothetical protein
MNVPCRPPVDSLQAASILLHVIETPQGQTVGQSLKELGLDPDPFDSAREAGNWWSFEVLGVRLYCFNFSWRRKALAFHDLHHVVTGYPCNMSGEMQVATWEYAAGSCPNWFAKLFCLPLVAMGAVLTPQQVFAAYKNGADNVSLFGVKLDSTIVNMPVAKLRSLTLKPTPNRSAARKLLGYSTLVALSVLMYILPLIALWMLILSG